MANQQKKETLVKFDQNEVVVLHGRIDIWWYPVWAVITFLIYEQFSIVGIDFSAFLTIPFAAFLELYFVSPLIRNKVVISKDKVRVEFGIFVRELPMKEIAALHKIKGRLALFCGARKNIAIESWKTITTSVAVKDEEEEKKLVDAIKYFNRDVRLFIG